MNHQQNVQSIKTIIFDWDGTLHESMFIYKPAFLLAYQYLVDHGYAKSRSWHDSEIKRFLGMNPLDMWASFEPKLSFEIIQIVSPMVSKAMAISIQSGKAQLYHGALDVIKTLKHKGYTLVYLSNSKTYYMEAMDKAFELSSFFDIMIASEQYQYIPKKEILNQIKDQLPSPWMVVGDRWVDIEAGKYHGALTVACDYGYGSTQELKDADHHISDIKEIMNLIQT
jgi:phosphoglycolate phosphatase